jgi:hypothetical protein
MNPLAGLAAILGAVALGSLPKTQRVFAASSESIPRRLVVNGMPVIRMEIDVPEYEGDILSRWASVGRTIGNANGCIENLLDGDDTEKTRDDCFYAQEELRQLGPSIEKLHMIIRDQLWRV